MTAEPRDGLALARWLDVALVVATVPVLPLLTGVPTLGVLVGAGIWVAQRVVGALLEKRAKSSGNAKTYTGLMLAGTLGRAWMTGLGILAVGLAGEREDGLAAAVLVLAAFTVYFILQLVLRPLQRSSARS